MGILGKNESELDAAIDTGLIGEDSSSQGESEPSEQRSEDEAEQHERSKSEELSHYLNLNRLSEHQISRIYDLDNRFNA